METTISCQVFVDSEEKKNVRANFPSTWKKSTTMMMEDFLTPSLLLVYNELEHIAFCHIALSLFFSFSYALGLYSHQNTTEKIIIPRVMSF